MLACFGRREAAAAGDSSGLLQRILSPKLRNTFLNKAARGDVNFVGEQLNSHPELLKSVSVLRKQNALHLAAQEGHIATLTAILEAYLCRHSARATSASSDSLGDVVNARDSEGRTPLYIACQFGHVECARFLVGNGAKRTLADYKGSTPLHVAAAKGHMGIIFLLLTEFMEELAYECEPERPPQQQPGGAPSGSDGSASHVSKLIHARNWHGFTPLHMACWGRQAAAVQILLQHGADLLAKSTRASGNETIPAPIGSTCLHLAATRGHIEISRLILKAFYETQFEAAQIAAAAAGQEVTLLLPSDPRVQINIAGHAPYQVAQRLGFFSLALLLRPNIPLPRLFNEEERGTRTWGPPPLKVLAAECLNHKLLRALESLSVTKPAPGASSSAAAALPNLGAQTAEVTNSEAQSAVVTAGAAAAAAASSGGETSAPRMPRPPQLDTTIAITTPFSSSSSLLVPVTPPSAPLTATRSAPWLSPFLIHQANSPGPAPGVTQAGAISEPQLPPGCSQPGEDSGNSRVGHTGDHILTGPATPQPQLPQGYMSTHQSTIHLSEEGAPEVSPGHQAAAGPHDPAVGTLTAAAAGTSTRGTHSNRGVQPAAYAGPSTTASLPAPAPGLSPSLSRAVTLAPHCGVPAIAVMARGSSITLSTAPRGSIPTTLQAGLDISPAPALDAVAGMVEETPVEQHRQHRAGSGCMPGLWEEGGAVHMHSHHRVQAAAAAGASGAPASPPVQWVAAQHCSSANAAAVTDGGDDAVEECGVCLEEDAFIQLLPCQHHLCKICSQKIFAARGASRCPFCRALVGDVCARQH